MVPVHFSTRSVYVKNIPTSATVEVLAVWGAGITLGAADSGAGADSPYFN